MKSQPKRICKAVSPVVSYVILFFALTLAGYLLYNAFLSQLTNISSSVESEIESIEKGVGVLTKGFAVKTPVQSGKYKLYILLVNYGIRTADLEVVILLYNTDTDMYEKNTKQITIKPKRTIIYEEEIPSYKEVKKIVVFEKGTGTKYELKIHEVS